MSVELSSCLAIKASQSVLGLKEGSSSKCSVWCKNNMKKRVILSLFTLMAIAIGVVGMSAFEAHIINVTAKIENALAVSTDNIPFGTVFPQEHLTSPLDIGLSESFLLEPNADDINYVIKQKPKPRPVPNGQTNGNGHNPNETIEVPPEPPEIPTLGRITDTPPLTDPMPPGETIQTEIVQLELVSASPIFIGPAHEFCRTHAPAKIDPDLGLPNLVPDFENLDSLYYDYCYPWLCPYVSKEKSPDDLDDNDTEVPSFHSPFLDVATGRLAKSEQDEEDNWIIDLSVPCFEGQCDQAWSHLGWELPPGLESEMFGCDLWIEVTGISRFGEGECGDGVLDAGEQCDDGNLENGDGCDENCRVEELGCSEKADVMSVLDRSGSIDDDELDTMQIAALAFVTALAPSADGVHMGQTSFATNGSLDLHLTGVLLDIQNAINGLVNDGFTNLKEGIELATGELADAHVHDRTDAESPDFMVIITDGNPNRPEGDPAGDATAAATAAKNAGTVIYVVGVGDDLDADYLRDNIASSAAHYFDAADFDALQTILESLAECNGDG